MTIDELSKYYYVSKNITKIKQRIEELNSAIISTSKTTSTKIDSTTNNDPTGNIAIKLVELTKLYDKEYLNLVDEELKIVSFLQTIKDEDIKYIIRSRFLELKSWNEIAKEITYSRTAPYNKLKKYLKERSNINE